MNVRNDLASTSKVDKRSFNPNSVNNQDENRVTCDRPGMLFTGILSGIILMFVLFLVFIMAHFETNRHLKEMTERFDRSTTGEY